MTSSKYYFYKSHHKGTIRTQPVFFYHLPKCGGMSIYATASAALQGAYHFEHLPCPVINRCDDAESEKNLTHIPYAFIAAHMPYGLHKRLEGSPVLMTVIRDPIKRLYSAYGYHCMRNGIEISLSDISTFANQAEHSNTMVKLLAGKPPDIPATQNDLETVIDRLSTNFAFVVTTRDISTMCESFLRHFSLPNVITTRINATPKKFKPDVLSVPAEIHELNALDAALHRHCYSRPLTLPKFDNPAGIPSLHPLTMVMTECGNEDASHFWATAIETELLFSDGLVNKDGDTNSEAIDHFIRTIRN